MTNWITLIYLSVNIIVWMQTAGTANGNSESPPWVILSGCFNYSLNNETNNIQNNEPTRCFEKCPSSQSVALKNMSCICNPLYTPNDILINSRCNLSCPGKSEVFCGSEGGKDDLMSVYTRGTLLPDNIKESYGYGYVVISGGKPIINASFDNTSAQHSCLCYYDYNSPGPTQCVADKSTMITWEDAMKICNGRGARLITNSDVWKCTTGGNFWIGIYREKPDLTTSTTTTSTSTTATATSTTSSTSFTSSKLTHSYQTTTVSRPSHNSDTTVIEQTSKASSGDTTAVADSLENVIKAVAVAVPIAVLLVVLGFILLCKKRKLLCFKKRQQSGEMNDDSNNASSREIPELISTKTPSSVPPGSTWAPFQSQRQNVRPTTARERDISDGHTVLNTNMSYTNMGMEAQYRFGDRIVGLELAHNEIEDTVQSNMNFGKKSKEKRVKKRSKKDKHSSSVDKEYEDSKGNTQDKHKQIYSHTNDDLSVVNGLTGHSNGEGQDKNETKRKKQRAKEHSYSDEEMKNAAPETGSGIFSEHQSERHVAPISPFNGMGNLHHEPNDKIKHNQVGPDPNEVLKESTDNNNVIRKEKKKKRKKTRERLKENVQNVYDEVGDPTTARLVLEEQSDLQNEESSKKHKKKRRKKHKKRDKMNAPKQEDLDLDNDEND